jgi:hypothetical protein
MFYIIVYVYKNPTLMHWLCNMQFNSLEYADCILPDDGSQKPKHVAERRWRWYTYFIYVVSLRI